MYKFKTATRIQLSDGVLGFYGDQPRPKISHFNQIIQDRRTRQYFIYFIFFRCRKTHNSSKRISLIRQFRTLSGNSEQLASVLLVPVEKVVRQRFCLPFLVENRFTRFNIRTTASIEYFFLPFSDSIGSVYSLPYAFATLKSYLVLFVL